MRAPASGIPNPESRIRPGWVQCPARGGPAIAGATTVVRVDPERFQPSALEDAARCVARGGLVVFPTETVYGIAANRDRPEAVDRLLKVRESPGEKLLTVHIHDRDQIAALGLRFTPAARRLIAKFWPGPLTIVFPTVDGGTLGVRYPSDPVARALLGRCGCRVVAPSANRSGRPPAVDGESARREFDGKVDYVIDAGPTRHRAASTVVRATGPKMEILREGAVPRAVVEEVGYLSVLFVCTGNTCRSPMAEGFLKKRLAQRLGATPEGLADRRIFVVSAGTAAGHGSPAAETAVEVLEEMGVDLSRHASRPVTATLLEDADFAFTMTGGQRETLLEWLPDAADRILPLDPDGGDVPDPVAGSREEYRRCAERLRALVDRRLSLILEAL